MWLIKIQMGRFFIYQEYGATYETMLQDISLAAKSITNWNSYQRGYEALANLVAPEKTRLLGSKKGLTFEDLMIKVSVCCSSDERFKPTAMQPIQRICKYPLLFADLCKQTPVTDGPESHMKIEKALFRLRETAAEINSATNNKLAKEAILRSWKLQDILVFQDPVNIWLPRNNFCKANVTLLDHSAIHVSFSRACYPLRSPSYCVSI